MKTHEQIMEELKQTDPESYNQIINESEKEIAEIRKWGGKRPNSGRKKQNNEKVKRTFEFEKADIVCLENYAKKHKISKNKALKEAIHILERQEA
jgi:hypothetical protein